MATDNDTPTVQGLKNRKNLEYKEDIALIDARLDRLNARLSADVDTDDGKGGTEDGTVDTATNAAVVLAKVQTDDIADRVDVLFPYVQQS